MTPPGAGRFVRPLTIDDDAIGGKARSLARLAALGLPTPSGFAVGASLFHRLRAVGPPLPTRLVSAADLARLDAARAALRTAPFPDGFEDELGAALDALGPFASGDAPDVSGTARNSVAPSRKFAVRSSVANEDGAGTLGAGIYSSILRVPRAEIADAVRRVLGSCLTPAAWVYAARWWTDNSSVTGGLPAGSVLIHPFVEGDAAGIAALAPAKEAPEPHPVRIDVHFGELAPVTRRRIDLAVRTAAARYGAVELEWVARDSSLTFLQLRAYRPVPNPDEVAIGGAVAAAYRAGAGSDGPLSRDDWIWDAAHNPLPLSPAQAGLVALVDAKCSVGFRQEVVGGYLFFRRSDDPARVRVTSAREALDRLAASIEPRLAALGPEPSLATTLELFVTAYQPLFGIVGPACVAARQALEDFVTQSLPNQARSLPDLLLGVPSAASRRRAAAQAICSATGATAQQAAIDEYLGHFGDESPRWDVAEPTLRETPDVLLRLAVSRPGRPSDSRTVDPSTARDPEVTDDPELSLDPSKRARFDELLAAARDSTAIAEDDDALYARLQAGVRRALLGIGKRLHRDGRLRAVDDVFFLPLDLVRALADPVFAGNADSPLAPGGDLNAVAVAGREAFREAAAVPPPLDQIHSPIAGIVRGLGGAAGRFIGRAVHHPSSLPTGPDTVLIASTLLPTELPLLAPGAMVIETGSLLGHVAAQARERGIPAVVGATGARAAIRPGTLVIVDGDRGEVVCLSRQAWVRWTG